MSTVIPYIEPVSRIQVAQCRAEARPTLAAVVGRIQVARCRAEARPTWAAVVGRFKVAWRPEPTPLMRFSPGRLLKNSSVPFSPREKVRMRGPKTMGNECDDSLTPALSRWERGRLGLFQQPARHKARKGNNWFWFLYVLGGFARAIIQGAGDPRFAASTGMAVPL